VVIILRNKSAVDVSPLRALNSDMTTRNGGIADSSA
jgi:Lhr-like helicase